MKHDRWTPTHEMVKRLKGRIDIYYDKRRGWLIRSWPRPPSGPRSPAVQAQMALFGQAAAAMHQTTASEITIAEASSKGTGFLPRDVLMTAMFGNLISWTTKAGVVRTGRKFKNNP